jgi:hypothetical protein
MLYVLINRNQGHGGLSSKDLVESDASYMSCMGRVRETDENITAPTDVSGRQRSLIVI